MARAALTAADKPRPGVNRERAAVEAPAYFGHYLRDLRQRRGWSQREVCAFSAETTTPLEVSALSRWESGKPMALRALPTISRLYDVLRIQFVALVMLLERALRRGEVHRAERLRHRMEPLLPWMQPACWAMQIYRGLVG